MLVEKYVLPLFILLFIRIFQLKKFRDEQQQNGDDHSIISSQTNGNSVHSNNGLIFPQDLTSFVDEQQAILNGIHENLSKSPVAEIEVSI
jgi:outer membrane protein OmpA-like peptidoglycan-associated protein